MKDMEICNDGHPPIAHQEGWKKCPMCVVKAELALEKEEFRLYESSFVSEKEDEIEELHEKIDDLEEALSGKSMKITELDEALEQIDKLVVVGCDEVQCDSVQIKEIISENRIK